MTVTRKQAAAAVVLALLAQKRKKQLNQKRLWVRNWIRLRDIEQNAQKLICDLRNEGSNTFKQFFRLSSEQFDFLLDLIRPMISKKDTQMRKAISADTRLALTLRYLSSGDSYRSLMLLFRVPHNTISGIVPKTCEAIYWSLSKDYLKVKNIIENFVFLIFVTILYLNSQNPNTVEEWLQIADDYWNKWNFPNCIGALDGKHVTIRCPSNTGSLNFNYKHTFSVVLLGMADANYKFLYVDVGCKGRVSDGGVYNNSTLCHALENGTLNIPPPRKLPGSEVQTPFVILADDAFALKTYIMKPFNFRGQNRNEHIFNYRLSRARRMIESTFGVMAARFRLLRTTIELSEKNVKWCILAMCVLHNWLMTIKPNTENPSSEIASAEESVEVSNEAPTTSEAKNIREILKNYFMTPAGEVHWQYDMA